LGVCDLRFYVDFFVQRGIAKLKKHPIADKPHFIGVCLPRKILQLKSRLNCLTLKLKNNEKVKIYREPDYGRYQGV